jgi:dienelactone hydrolase
MRRPSRSLRLAAAVALAAPVALSPLAGLNAQQTAPTSTPPSKPAVARPASALALRTLGLADYGRWNRVTSTALAPNGAWMTYAYQPNDGDATLHVKQLDGDKSYSIPIGSAPAGGAGAGGFGGGGGATTAFSDNGRWVGYYVNPPAAPAGGRGRGGQGGPGAPGTPSNPNTPAVPGGRGAGAPAAGGAARRFELLDVNTGEKFSVPNAASYKFSKGSRWIAVRVNRAPGDTTREGADLVLRELATGATRNIGNVNLYDFDEAGRLFAYTVDAAGKLGNGIYLMDLASGETRPLSSANATYDQLTWSAEGSNLAVLKGEKPRGKTQRENVLLTWSALGTPKMKAVEFDPSKDSSFAKGMTLSEFAAPRWSDDGSRIFLGLKEQDTEPARSDEPQANVDVWHWKDPDPQSVQMVRIAQERRSTYPAAFVLGSHRFVKLGDGDMRTVTPTATGTWAIGRIDTPYRGEVAWGGSRGDYYRVNTATGERTLIDRSLTRTMGTSPDGRWFLYLKDRHVRATNLETMKTVDLDDSEKISFLDAQDDHPYEKPVYGVAGWSKDGKSLLMYHRYDIWQLPLDGGRAVNLTQGMGEKESIQFRLVRFDGAARGGRGGRGGGFGAQGDDEGIDLSKPLTLSAYGEWTKKFGYYSLVPGKAPVQQIFAEKQISQAQKAANADRVIFTEQTYNEFPDWWVTNTAFAAPKKITDANPQLAEYAWSKGKVLIDYTNSKGQKLQGTLTLPANYEPGKKYPMLVYFYELMSNTHHQFSTPTYDDRPQNSTYTSDGYLYFQPDVVYEIGKPGSSALDCVTSAVKKVIELGYADPKHIGLQGHSWGGYQSSFILTQTDIFAAVVTGAPPTNLISFYDETYPGTGTLQQGIVEVGQVRMGTNPWESHDLFEQQSPIYHVRNIKTPFMILHGTADNAVDWHQGLELYGAARRWGKNVIFLSYPGEPHHLAKKENQKDFQIRMKQFFDHYLKDGPSPKWMTDGLPQTRKGAAIE